MIVVERHVITNDFKIPTLVGGNINKHIRKLQKPQFKVLFYLVHTYMQNNGVSTKWKNHIIIFFLHLSR
jgi:hypothetical protein